MATVPLLKLIKKTFACFLYSFTSLYIPLINARLTFYCYHGDVNSLISLVVSLQEMVYNKLITCSSFPNHVKILTVCFIVTANMFKL